MSFDSGFSLFYFFVVPFLSYDFAILIVFSSLASNDLMLTVVLLVLLFYVLCVILSFDHFICVI